MSTPADQRFIRGSIVDVLFMISGAAGLMYQVVWSRELVLVFGNTTQAISTIVTAVMFGLGLGGYVGGWRAPRNPNLLRLYGLLELCVAAAALTLPFFFNGIGEVYRSAYGSLSVFELTAVRFMLAFMAVSPATFFMGMTLPVLTQFRVVALAHVGRNLGALYSANTLGAVAGTLVAGFVLIELIGLSGTTYVAIFLNAFVGLVAIWGSRGSRTAGSRRSAESNRGGASVSRGRIRAILAVTFVSGFVSLSLEILFTRLLAEGTGSFIYILVGVLAAYLSGIAIGSALYNSCSSEQRDTLSALGLCFAVVATMAVLMVSLGSGMIFPEPFRLELVLLLPATLCLGYDFPFAGRLIAASVHDVGQSVGRLYAFNTAGSILGAFSAAFLMAGTIGTNDSILVLAAITLVMGALLVTADARERGVWH